jgi:4'-phosphopantetheinyl transferase
MALFELKDIENHSQIGIWKIEESIQELELLLNSSIIDTEKYNKFKSDNRKKEWLTTRVLLRQMLNNDVLEIQYDLNRKPFLKTNTKISISHSKGYVALMLSDVKDVGVDIQVPKKNIAKGISVFMSPIELDEIGEENYYEKLHIYWCAKESLYKYVGDNKLNIYSHFKINPLKVPSDGTFKGVVKPTNKIVNLKYEITDLFYLVYTV